MKRLYRNAFVPAIAALILTACSSQSVDTNNAIAFSRLSDNRSVVYEGSAEAYFSDKDINEFDTVSLVLPTVIGTHDIRPLQDSIFMAAFDTTGVEHHALIDGFFDKVSDLGQYKARIVKSDSLSLQTADGYNSVNGIVISLTGRFLVYCVTKDYYEPRAAHGASLKKYINYNIITGRFITLADIFTANGMKELPALIAERANSIRSSIGPTDITSLPSGGNFYISPDEEIVFVYQEYEVASYAQGIISISFSPYELTKYMTPEAIDLFGLQGLGNV